MRHLNRDDNITWRGGKPMQKHSGKNGRLSDNEMKGARRWGEEFWEMS